MSSSLAFDQEQMLPVLPAEWRWHSLQELVDPSRGICYGIVQPGNHDPYGVPMVNSGNVFNGRVTPDVSFRVMVELHKKYERSTLRGGEVLVTLVGANFGQVAIAPMQYAGHNCARPVGVVPVLEGNRFVMYALQSPLLRQRMDNVANTTAQPTLNLKDLGRLPIPIPPLHIREGIAELLGALDDRITLLRETNTTLEAIAQALFKSWFVDFDPVHAKREGRAPEGMDEATARLFPDSFEESELGLVPSGWRVGTAGEHTSYLNRGISPKYIEDGGIVVINQKCIRDFSLDMSKARRHDPAQRKVDGRELLKGDILVNSTGVGTLGRVAQVLTLKNPAIVDSHVTVMRAGASLTWNYLGLLIMRRQSEIEGMGEGSTGQTELSRGKLAALKLLVPSAAVLKEFDEVALPLRERFSANQTQAQTLATLRDTLLPRLISGQLRLPEAQAAAEEALA